LFQSDTGLRLIAPENMVASDEHFSRHGQHRRQVNVLESDIYSLSVNGASRGNWSSDIRLVFKTSRKGTSRSHVQQPGSLYL